MRNAALLGNNSNEVTGTTQGPPRHILSHLPIQWLPTRLFSGDQATDGETIERPKLMQEAAKKLEFIEAAQYRDELLKLEDMMKERWGRLAPDKIARIYR